MKGLISGERSTFFTPRGSPMANTIVHALFLTCTTSKQVEKFCASFHFSVNTIFFPLFFFFTDSDFFFLYDENVFLCVVLT